jgi:hypothetical protein
LANAIAIRFGESVIDRLSQGIDVFARDGQDRVRPNQGRSGEWIEWLAAGALLRRTSPSRRSS